MQGETEAHFHPDDQFSVGMFVNQDNSHSSCEERSAHEVLCTFNSGSSAAQVSRILPPERELAISSTKKVQKVRGRDG